jgi:hypothetical protein
MTGLTAILRALPPSAPKRLASAPRNNDHFCSNNGTFFEKKVLFFTSFLF